MHRELFLTTASLSSRESDWHTCSKLLNSTYPVETIGVPAEAKYLDALACYKAAFVACSLVLIPMVVSSWYLDDFKYVFGKVGENMTLLMRAT